MGFGQTGDEHPRWSFPLGEGKPVIIKAEKVCADQEAGLLDIQETKLSPQRRQFVRYALWSD